MVIFMNSQNKNQGVWLYNIAWYDGRQIGELCLKYHVILHGLENNGWGSTSKCFSTMQEGDFVVMRWWQENYRVGQIVGTLAWHDEFRNIDGWDLSRVRRVRWLSKEVTSKLLEEFNCLKSISAKDILKNISKHITHTKLIIKLEQFDSKDKSEEPLKNLTEPAVEFEAVSKDNCKYLDSVYEDITTLIDEAPICIPDTSVEGDSNSRLKDQLRKMTELLKWYELNWYNNSNAYPSEHETICHFVVPLLRVLGWNQKQIAVEWRIPGELERIDIALFQDQDNNSCQRSSLLAIVEVKQLGKALLPAYSQALEYWEKLEREKNTPCKRIIVTDGRRYIIYKNTKENFDDNIYAYMDLARPRHQYPVYYECEKGFQEALLAMLPNKCP